MHLSNESLIVIVIVGIVAGWLASNIVRGGGCGQFGRQLRLGDVRLLGDLLQKKTPDAVRAWRGGARRWAWGRGFPHPKGFHQVDGKGNRHPEMRRGRGARMTFIDIADNALTQIK
jgi:hypothetical protein